MSDWGMLELVTMDMRLLTATAACIALSVPAMAAPGGNLGTLPLGAYHCALPGDAAGQAWIPLEDKNFTIDNASTYLTSKGSGTYLLTGKRVIFTRGPMNGMRFERTGSSTLRWIDENGDLANVRCVRTNAAR
jgi:hypothetical protein